jgi:hypothetical protein
MKYLLNYCIVFTVCLLASCKKESAEPIIVPDEDVKKQMEFLPFVEVDLKDLSAFKPTNSNWKLVGNVNADRTKDKMFISSEGTGILLNTNDQEKNKNIFTSFEHGDMELELDVMMPISSNSGIYFQGRYEIQLFDSWGVEHPKYVDMGGVYQRWDDTKEKGSEGYEGHSPKSNAAKAPGLWQHLKVIFHAPKFDADGNKTKNAWFEEVWLNGVLIHENVEVTGPTRAAMASDEKANDALMIQGDHGPVAFKNIKYKLYDDSQIGIENTTLKIYDNSNQRYFIGSLDSLKLLEEHATDSISPIMSIDRRDQKVVSYTGTLNIPDSGDYLFEAKVNGGAYLIINNDSIVNLNTDADFDTPAFNKVYLEKGPASFKFVYNKPTVWRTGFDFFVEGPNMQRYSFLKTGTVHLNKQNPIEPITIEVTGQPVTQRSFLNHEGVKRSHCISIGLVEKLNYSLDLETATLLHVWSGEFLDATQMWHARGEHQRGEPIGFSVSSHGDLDFASLESDDAIWPKTLSENIPFKQLGYEFKDNGIPVFLFEIDGAKISHSFTADSNSKRGVIRTITMNAEKPLWHKIADGESISALPNNTFVVNNESYYIVFPQNIALKPIVRKSNGKDELIVEIPKGNQTFNYSIIW